MKSFKVVILVASYCALNIGPSYAGPKWSAVPNDSFAKDSDLSIKCTLDNSPKNKNSQHAREWHACVTQDNRSRSNDVLWFFPGAWDNEKAWTHSIFSANLRLMRETWKRAGVEAPVVATVFFGGDHAPLASGLQRLYMFNEELLSEFSNEVVPEVQKQIPQGGRQLAFGLSMGGFNLIRLIQKKPQMFLRAVIGFPMIVTDCSPFASGDSKDKCIQEELKTRQALKQCKDYDYLCLKGSLESPKEFFNQEEWGSVLDEILNPAKNIAAQQNSPDLYVEVGSFDEMKFYKGTLDFWKQNAVKKNNRNVLVINNGGHSQMNAQFAAQFLISEKLREPVEFEPLKGN